MRKAFGKLKTNECQKCSFSNRKHYLSILVEIEGIEEAVPRNYISTTVVRGNLLACDKIRSACGNTICVALRSFDMYMIIIPNA